ncbi:MAG: hypothetical protein EXR49_07210 [Dehalococcoidia bacterium]|nr:hypothetical protein [Dehalococcoidia bacterium]
MTLLATKPRLKVADEAWVATALLHREHPDRLDFEALEIREKAREQRSLVAAQYREITSVYQHAILHCVANLPRQTGAYRMLFATGRTTRRLFRPGDSYHPSREGGRMLPDRASLPSGYRALLDWYAAAYAPQIPAGEGGDPIMRLKGLGRSIWGDESPDQYVQRLRAGWS